MSKLEISGTGLPGSTKVRLDGYDVTADIAGLRLALDVRSKPQLELDLRVRQMGLEVDQVQVVLPDSARELLVRAGWTPPSELVIENHAAGSPEDLAVRTKFGLDDRATD